MKTVSVLSTASILPQTVVTNRDIGQRLIEGARARNVRDDEAEATARSRAEVIEQKTGLRSRRFFSADENPVDTGVALLEQLMGARDWAQLDAVIVSSSSTQGFPRLYESLGFRAFGREPGSMQINGEFHDEIHMYLRLAEA